MVTPFAHSIHRVQVFTSDGKPATTYSAYQDALGIKDVAWNASGELLSVGSYDEVRWQKLIAIMVR